VAAGKKDLHGDFGAHCYVGFRHSFCHGWAGGPTAWLRVATSSACRAGRTRLRQGPHHFHAVGPQCARLKNECGTVPAIAGIFKAPFDIIGDKLRGYLGLTMDMFERPEKVLAACEALMPHLCHVGLTSADPAGQLPIGFWMHRGCEPFVSRGQFESHYWPTLKPIIEEFWRHGHQTMFYAEGDWTPHLETFTALPDRSILYHVDRGSLAAAHRVLGHKFCLSGGIPNTVLSFGTADEVRACCKRAIDTAGRDGGYIMDASAIMQNDTSTENLRALTDFTREYGVYSDGRSDPASAHPLVGPPAGAGYPPGYGMSARLGPRVKAGICIPWEEEESALPPINGDRELVRNVWEDIEGLGNMFIWQCLLSF
jgi:hypothetical protein